MKKLLLVAAIATLPIISFAQDGIRGLPKAGAFSVTPEFGVDVIDNSKYSSAYSETLAGAGTYLGRAATAAVTFSSTAQNFDQVFDRALNYGASFNYGLSDSTELFGRFKYTHADAKDFDALNVSAALTYGGVVLAGASTLKGKMSDFDSYGFEVGSRFFFNNDSAFKPFIAPSLGMTRVSSMDLEKLTFNGSNVLANSAKFYDATWTYNLGVGVGFRYDISKNIAAGLETGYRYQSSLDSNHSDLGRASMNNKGERSFIPLTAGLNISF
jgi:hypothetical protein